MMQFEESLRDRESWSIENRCSMARTLDVLSTKTTFLVLRECFYGTTRFEDFVSRTSASAPAVSRALRQLEDAQIVARVPYREQGSRTRHAYELTTAGEDLLPVFLALMEWGDAHLQHGSGPLAFYDRRTRRRLRIHVAPGPPSAVRSDAIEIRGRRATSAR